MVPTSSLSVSGAQAWLMDEVQYEIVPGQKNELRMVKRLKK